MDQHGVASFHHRKTPSSDRFLSVFSPPEGGSVLSTVGDNNAAGDELNEYDVFWTGDFTEPQRRSSSYLSAQNNLRKTIQQPEKFGILAALSEDRQDSNYPMLYRTASLSPPSSVNSSHKTLKSTLSSPMAQFSRAIPAFPKPQSSLQLAPARKFQHSAPVNVPIYSHKPSRFGPETEDDADADADAEADAEADDEMLPPHEIVARSNRASSTFSVLEGAGRTLKGRDLRQVRNAVWRQTGFLD